MLSYSCSACSLASSLIAAHDAFVPRLNWLFDLGLSHALVMTPWLNFYTHKHGIAYARDTKELYNKKTPKLELLCDEKRMIYLYCMHVYEGCQMHNHLEIDLVDLVECIVSNRHAVNKLNQNVCFKKIYILEDFKDKYIMYKLSVCLSLYLSI